MSSEPRRPKGAPLKTLGIAAASVVIGLLAGVFIIGSPSHDASAPARENRGGGSFERGARAPAVVLANPGSGSVDDTVTAIGTGRAVQSLTLTADVSGVIAEVLVETGRTVKAGAPLIKLEEDEQDIAVARTRADYNVAKTNAARFQGLVADEAASALEYEAAKNALSATTAQLRQAEYDLARRTIRAPFAGVVGLTKLNIGDYLVTGSTIATIDDISSLLVDFVVPEGASAFVREGLEVSAVAQASGGRIVKGRVRAVDSRVDSASRTRRVEAILDNPDGSLIPGSTFSITLVASGRTAHVLPGLALQWDRTGSFVWKANDKGAAERVPVTILQRNAESILVEGPLTPSDLIVVEGAASVRAGAALRAHSADGRAANSETTSAF